MASIYVNILSMLPTTTLLCQPQIMYPKQKVKSKNDFLRKKSTDKFTMSADERNDILAPTALIV